MDARWIVATDRHTFIKALDVWSEYAVCWSSAQFRPEATVDFDRAFCLALEESRSASQRWIENYRDGGDAAAAFREIQQVFGDTFICPGYLLGHLHCLELRGFEEAPAGRKLLFDDSPVAELIASLERILHELWLMKFAWQSLEIVAPIYDLLCEMMALHGMAFARHGDEWRIVMSNESVGTSAQRDFLMSKAKVSFYESSGSSRH